MMIKTSLSKRVISLKMEANDEVKKYIQEFECMVQSIQNTNFEPNENMEKLARHHPGILYESIFIVFNDFLWFRIVRRAN